MNKSDREQTNQHGNVLFSLHNIGFNYFLSHEYSNDSRNVALRRVKCKNITYCSCLFPRNIKFVDKFVYNFDVEFFAKNETI